MTVRLTLFGTLQLHVDNQPPLRFPTHKARALLAYLVVENGRLHSRSSLVNRFWPGSSDKQGRQSLSQTLRRLRLTLATVAPELFSQTFQATAQDIMAVAHQELVCDVVTFQQLLARTTAHEHASLQRCPACLAWLEQAIALYQGDFLADFKLPNAPAFEEWAAWLRSQLQRQAVQTLETLMTVASDQGDYDALERYARQQVTLEPWREEGWKQLLLALLRLNRRSEAVQRYHQYRQSLQRELGIQPSFTLRQLVEQGQAESLPNAPTQPAPGHAWQALTTAVSQGKVSAHDFAISQAGDRLLFVGADGKLQLWDAALSAPTEQKLEALLGQETAVTAIALSPNGRLAAAGDEKGRIICWQVADGTMVRSWTIHDGSILRLTFLPDSAWLLSAGASGRLQLWNPWETE